LKKYRILIILVFYLNHSQGQINFKNYNLTIRKTVDKIKIDGELNELSWKSADVAKDFFMITPVDTEKATQFSEARVSFDEDFFYIAIIFFNNTVKGNYVIESLKRDFSFGKNDNFLVAIDPFINQTTGFAFGLNAYGAQWDGTMYDGRRVDLNWDSKWYSKVKFDEDKWICEIGIPFKSIRYNENNSIWGINFSRLDLKASEKSSWAPVPRQFPSVSLAYTGSLVWEDPPPKQVNNISLIPYGASNSTMINEKINKNNIKVGGDLKYNLTSALNLDVTLNPDFSQAEIDRQVTNLDRFELFFPERRQFFLENADLFSNFGYQTIRPFFSRRIGLNVPIIGGVRISGNLDEKWRLGLMTIQTQKDENLSLSANNFSVLSLQKKVFNRSNLNLIYVNKQELNSFDIRNFNSSYNQNIGLEFNYFSEDNFWNGKLLYLKSFDNEEFNKGSVFASHIGYQSINWNLLLQQEYISEDYFAEVGFVPRKNYFKIQAKAAYLNYTKDKTSLLSHGPSLNQTYFFDTLFENKDKLTTLQYRFNFINRSRLSISFRNQFVKLLSGFDPLRTGISELKADSEHTWNNFTISYNSKPQNRFTYSIETIAGGYYSKGKRKAILSELSYRFQPFLELNSVINYNQIKLPYPWKENSFWLLGFKANLTFTKTIFFTNLFQFNEQLGLWNFNSRFQWRYKPASDIFLVFNSNEIIFPSISTGWNLTFKINYWLNI